VAIRTSLIAGYPGETDSEFMELCQFVEAAKFDHLGVFSYSDEETSASFRLPDKVDRRIIHNRRRHLMAIQRKVSRRHRHGLVGREFAVLVEGLSPDTDLLWQARLSTQAPEIDGVCYVNDVEGPAPAPGQRRKFRVTAAHDYDLVGTLLS
jgi:ribosomal protein S12 methylthiotransferase